MHYLRTYIALITFLGSYFLLTVAGNLIYFTPLGESIGGLSRAGFSMRIFEFAGSPGYWILLFLPFVVAPPITIAAKRLLAPLADLLPTKQASEPAFFGLVVICYCVAAWSLWRADAVDLLFQGSSFEQAVRSRFELMAALGFWPLVLIKAVMVTISIFALVMAIRDRSWFWLCMVLCNFVGMTVLLALLNAKWPLVLFYLSHLIAVILFAEKPLLPGAAVAVCAIAGYSIASMVLLRAIPVDRVTLDGPTAVSSPSSQRSLSPSPERLRGVAMLALAAPINRMAQPFPYYYDTFTREPGKCGTILDRVKRITPPCHPSNLIYAEIFKDKFGGLGTAPQSVHVSGYALGGWFVALLELAIASVIMGALAAIATVRSPIGDTVTVLGALTGYFFSQLPVEGPIIYDHGILWGALLLGILALFGLRHAPLAASRSCSLPPRTR
jgi:hypothetical protein